MNCTEPRAKGSRDRCSDNPNTKPLKTKKIVTAARPLPKVMSPFTSSNGRPAAGRAWHVPQDVGEAYYRILVVCYQWPPILRALSSEGRDGRGEPSLRADLPPDVRGSIRKAHAAIGRLQSTVSKRFRPAQRENA